MIPTLAQHLAAHQHFPNSDLSGTECECGWTGPDSFDDWAAHVAATFREARTVTTAEELATLAEKTFVCDKRGRTWESFGEYWVPSWTPAPKRVPLPVRVLWVPADEEGAR